MDWETFEKHKPFAGDKKPSMLRRRIGHDYESRRIYLITMTVEGRRPILGSLVGDADAPEGSSEAPRVVLSPLGEQVRQCWLAILDHYPEIRILATMVMPDHLHGILFVERKMEQHLGMAIKGFKAGCNKAFRLSCLSMLQHCCSKGNNENKKNKGNNENKESRGSIENKESRGGIENKENRGSIGNKENRRNESGLSQGFLWARNYNDHILEGAGELRRWFDYLSDNPRRLAIRRAHPEYFCVRFGVTIGGHDYAAIGNRFLLSYPNKLPVQCSRSLTEEQIKETVERMLEKARRGVVLISPAISKGEKAVMRAVLEERLPLIFLTPWGFNAFSRPGHQYYEACAEGRFLILAPWEHQNNRLPITREMCQQLNKMAATIAQGP